MYLLPLLFSNLHLGLDAPFDPFDTSLDPTLGRPSLVQPEELVSRVLDRYYPVSFDRGVLDFYHKPWLSRKEHVVTSVDGDVYKISMNVQRYKPEEVTAKLVDRWVIVEARHEDKKNEGDVVSQQQFVRRFLLPNRADVDQVKSTLSSDGVLTITAPLKPKDERVIRIEQTGQPAVSSDGSQKEAGANVAPKAEKKTENNDVLREEATRTQEAGPKPEK